MRYVAGVDEQGRAVAVQDPLGPRLKEIATREGLDAARLVPALAGFREVFGDDLPRDPRFLFAVTSALGSLISRGAGRTIADYAQRR
jgi:fructuronate reductase